MRRRTFLTLGTEGIKASKATACDVCLYNKSTQKLLIVKSSDFNLTSYPSSNYSPVGVVVIPGNHNIYGTGECAVMSLKLMCWNAPDTGSTDNWDLFWGQHNVVISNLTKFSKVCYVGSNGNVNQTVQGVNDYACLPSDMFTTVQNPYDKDTYFEYNDDDKYAPSPYNEDDSRNPAYYQTSSPSDAANALSDFDGIGNTEILCSLATKQSDWKTVSTITNNSAKGYSPAACCCWRYHTEGTKQGDWYLPAIGELGYIMPKLKKINQAISTLISAYGSTVGVEIDWTNNTHWSSSDHGSSNARELSAINGFLDYNSRDSINYHVRAFLRVK